MGLGDLINKVGDGLEHAASGAEHALGKAADVGAHAAGGALDSVGLHGAAHAVDGFGDSVADHLGAQVAEQKLGQTNDPKQLVHGDVGAIRQSAGHLRKFAAAFEETAQGLKGMDTSHWTGQAADAFGQALGKHVPMWSDAGRHVRRHRMRWTLLGIPCSGRSRRRRKRLRCMTGVSRLRSRLRRSTSSR